MATSDLIFMPLPASDIPTALVIEQEGYPEDEAGSLESFTLRQSQAPSLFLGAYSPFPNGEPGELVGYICATLSDSPTLTHSSMSTHVPNGQSVCIHSVCVKNSHRRRGIALALLKEYISRAQESVTYERILLIAHDNLRGLYEKAGFEWVGESSVVHGKEKWYEMRIILKGSPAQASSSLKEQSLPPQISPEALQGLLRPSSQKRTPGLLSEFSGIEDLTTQDPSSPGTLLNKYDLLCPRGCRSIIMKSKCAQFVERSTVLMEPSDAPLNSLLPRLPLPPSTTNWWLVTGSPMTFENIGFSRPVGSLSETPGKRMKLLICSECDLGPLGWCEEGGSEFWLAIGRVGYRNDAASTSSGRHTIPISPSFSTDSSTSSTRPGGPNSEATSDEQPNLGAFGTVLRALSQLQPAPRIPLGFSAASAASTSRMGTIQDRTGYSYSDASQSSVSSFTHPHLSSAAVSATDEDAPETVWDQRPIWSSYLRSESAASKSDSPSDSDSSEPRTVEITSDVDNDTRSILDSIASHSQSRFYPYSQPQSQRDPPPLPVAIQVPASQPPHSLSSLSSLDLNDSFSTSQHSQRTLRRGNFPVQNDMSTIGSTRPSWVTYQQQVVPSHSQSQSAAITSSSPPYYNQQQQQHQELIPRHTYLPAPYHGHMDSEAAVLSLLEEATRKLGSRQGLPVVNDVSSISSSSRGRRTPDSTYTRGSDDHSELSSYSVSLQSQASGYSGTSNSTVSEIVLAPQAYPYPYPSTLQRPSYLHNFSPQVESPLPTPEEGNTYDGKRRKEEHDYDLRTPTRTLGTSSGAGQGYHSTHMYPHPLVGLHVLPNTPPSTVGASYDPRQGSGNTEPRSLQREAMPTAGNDTDDESIKYQPRPPSEATSVSEQILLSPLPQSKPEYFVPPSSSSVTSAAIRPSNPSLSNHSQPSATTGYKQPSTTTGYDGPQAGSQMEHEHPTLGALDEALSFIAAERARLAALQKRPAPRPTEDVSSEEDGEGIRVQVESGGSGGPLGSGTATAVEGENEERDDKSGIPPQTTVSASTVTSSGRRRRRKRRPHGAAAAAAAALSQSHETENGSVETIGEGDSRTGTIGSMRLSKSSSTSTITGGSSFSKGNSLGPGRPLLLAPKMEILQPRPPSKGPGLVLNMRGSSGTGGEVEECDWVDEEEQDLLRTPRVLPRSKPSSKGLKEVPKPVKEKAIKEEGRQTKSGGITILTRPNDASTSTANPAPVLASNEQKVTIRTRPVVEYDGEDGEREGIDSSLSGDLQGSTAIGGQSTITAAGSGRGGENEKVDTALKGFSLSGKMGRRVGRRERQKEKQKLDARLGIAPAVNQGALITSDDNDESAEDIYDDNPDDDDSPSLAQRFYQDLQSERIAELYSSSGGEVLAAGLRSWHLQRASQAPGPSLSIGSQLGYDFPGAGAGSGGRTPRPADSTLNPDELLFLEEPPVVGAADTTVTRKKKKRSRTRRSLLSRSKSYPNLRAATELGVESLKRRLGLLASGSRSGVALDVGSSGFGNEPDSYIDQNKRNRLYLLAHRLLALFPEQYKDLKRVILKLEQGTLNAVNSSSSSSKKKKKGHANNTSSGYGSGSGIGTTLSMASFSNPEYIDYDEPQDPAEFEIQGPVHTPGGSIVHVFIDHSNILIGLLNFLKRHPPPQSTVEEYLASRMKLASHSTPALIDVDDDGNISIPNHDRGFSSQAPYQQGSSPISIPGKGKNTRVEGPDDFPIPLPSFAATKATPSSNPQAPGSDPSLSKSLPSDSFLAGRLRGVDSDSNDEGSKSRKVQTPKFPRHIWHAALALILERGRPISRRVVVTSSPLHQPMEKIERLGYEVRVYIRVPDLGDGMDRRDKSNANNAGVGKSNASQFHSKAGAAGGFGMTSSPAARGFAHGAVSAFSGSPASSSMAMSNAGTGTSAKKGHTRHLSGYTSNESGSGSNRDTPNKVRYREQGVDELLQLKLHQALADVDVVPKGSTIVLATGDGNVGQFSEDGFLGPVRLALRKGWKVELYAWEDGLSKAWRREFGPNSEYGQKGHFKIIPLEQFATSLIEAAGW